MSRFYRAPTTYVSIQRPIVPLILVVLVLLNVITTKGNQTRTRESQTFQDLIKYIHSYPASNFIEDIFKLLSNPDFVNSLNASAVGNACCTDLEYTARSYMEDEMWALKMIDSFGKPGSAILNQQMKWIGSYDQCVAVSSPPNFQNSSGDFSGTYCKVAFSLSPTNFNFPGYSILPFIPPIELGTCVPNTCSSFEVEDILKAAGVLNNEGISLEGLKVVCEEERSLDTEGIVAICILSVLGFSILISTLYDIICVHMLPELKPSLQRKESFVMEEVGVIKHDVLADSHKDHSIIVNGTQPGKATTEANQLSSISKEHVSTTIRSTKKERIPKGLSTKLLISLSVFTNGKKLLKLPEERDHLAVLHGIKFLSMSWIILGHSFLFVLRYAENAYDYMLTEGATLSFMAIQQAGLAVDSFLTISGLLVAYTTITEMKRVDGIRNFSWLKFFFHRIWRLTPTYLLVLMVFSTLMKHWIRGPFVAENKYIFDDCKDSWWTNMLYINNFVKVDQMCMGWTWYLADNMQFYILSPLILIPLFYSGILGSVVCGVFVVASIMTTAGIVMDKDFHAQHVFKAVPWLDDGEYAKQVYMPCYTRIGPFAVGLFAGYMVRKEKFRCHLPKVVTVLSWTICVLICMLTVYGPYAARGEHILTDDQSTSYEALSRTGWSIAVCWIVFACTTGHGGWINTILSWKLFVPLGRLTYCAYLVHPLVILTYVLNRRVPVYLNSLEMIYVFLSSHVLSYGIAFVVSLSFESPMMALENALLKRKR